MDGNLLPLLRLLCADEYQFESEVSKLCVSHLPKLIAIAKENDESLKIVLEILIATLDDDDEMSTAIIPHALTLASLVKRRWDDELLVHSLVRFFDVICTGHKEENVKAIVKKGILGEIGTILMLMFNKHPQTISVTRNFSYPKYLGEPLSNQSTVLMFYNTLCGVAEICGKPAMLSVSKKLLPITNHLLEELGVKGNLNRIEDAKQSLSTVVAALMNVIQAKDTETHRDIVAGNSIVLLMNAYSISKPFTYDRFDIEPLPLSLKAIELFFRFHNGYTPFKDIGARSDMLPNLLAIINNKRLLKDDIELVHGGVRCRMSCPMESVTSLTYAEYSIAFATSYIMEGGEEFLKPILNSNFVAGLVKFACGNKDNGISESWFNHYLEGVSRCFCVLAEVIDSKQSPHAAAIFQQMAGFMSLVAPLVVDPSLGTKSEDVKLVVKENVPAILGFMVKCKKLDLVALEHESGILLSYCKILKSANKKLLGYLVEMFHDCSRTHGIAFIATELLRNIPLLWKKIRNNNKCLWKTKAMKLTLDLGAYMKLDSVKEYSDLEYLMSAWLPGAEEPINVGGMIICWKFVTKNPGGLLSKSVTKQATKTGLNETKDKIPIALRYLTDKIVGYLDQDPPLTSEYLVTLTKMLVHIAGSNPSNEESILLEDFVCPAMWLLEKKSDEQIVGNVKEFISILNG